MNLLLIALKSARFRRTSIVLTVIAIAISATLLLGVDKVRKEARSSFFNTVSQTDLIVGARSSPTNLLLYSVFRIGNATNNVSWETYESIADRDEVAWTIPISLGDSHRGFRVMGTSSDYFDFYRYGSNKALTLDSGDRFEGVYEAVLGADVARDLGYDVGDEIVVSHGLTSADFAGHDDKPFTVVGIFDRTGTPVDRTVHVSLAGIEAIHVDWIDGSRSGVQLDAEQALQFDLTPTSITAFMVGLKNRAQTFTIQREINDYRAEPVSAILPGATLSQFWRTISPVEQVLFVISGFVLLAGLLGMLTTILSTLNERRREIAVLRAVGARGRHVVMLIVLETLLVVTAGCALGVGMLYGLIAVTRPVVARRYGVDLAATWLDSTQLSILGGVIGAALVVALIPGFIAYRRSIHDGLALKV
ncbi:MAG: ABC transporter permease [Ilumatobacter sp.]|nr:ABC transporter permease [Ilumatobacter sp.]MDG2040606.1 ABC transporter permease [Ilumatobacter sp.]